MKPIRSMLLILALCAAGASGAQAEDEAAAGLALGSPAPLREAKMVSVDGKAVAIADVAGKKGTLVIFMCNHCPWVQAWQGRIAAIGNAAASKGVGTIAINSNDIEEYPADDLEHMQAQAKKQGFKFPYVMDASSDVGRAFGATRTPEVFLFDARGKLVYHGAIDDNARNEGQVKERWLRKAVDAVVAGRAVPVGETKAFGCGIKLRGKSDS
jgi:hypothetical protein